MSTAVATDNLQTIFLNQIRQSLPKNLSFADELAEVLAVSRDSAYRRIRGETVLSLEEVGKLCARYNVSLDQLMSQSSEVISFNRQNHAGKVSLGEWLRNFSASLKMVRAYEKNEIIFSARDIPPPYYFKFPELAIFKMFFWMKSYQRDPQFENLKYQPERVPTSFLDAGTKLWQEYSEATCTEIWSEETFNVTIRQIEFYFANGFITLDQATTLFDEYLKMVNDIRASAGAGKRDGNGDFKFYSNDFLISDTTVLFKLGIKRMVFITYNTMNILATSQEPFCQETEEFLTNILSKSTLISTTGERERNRFFNAVEAKIKQRVEHLR